MRSARPLPVPRALLALLALALLAALSACGGDDEPTSESGDEGEDEDAAAADTDEAGQESTGGTLTIAVEADLRESDHLQARITVDKLIMGSTVFDPLFESDQQGNPAPALAREATPNDDATEWTIQLQEDVLFHNGKEFTAEDVVANIEAFLDPEHASNMAGDIENVAGAEATGSHEVVISLDQPDGELPVSFMDTIFMADMDDYDPEGTPIGTGPYQWGERVFGDRIEFTPFEDHWRGTPPLDEVVFRVIPDPQVAAVELQSGDVDIVPNYLPADGLADLRDDPNVEVVGTQGLTYYQALLNFEKARNGGYDDPEAFREGLALLWNVEEIVPPIIGEFGEVATQPIPPWMQGYNDDITPWEYDPERGQELLAQAGVEEGDELHFVVWNRPYNCDHATAFGSQLTELGYEVDVECLEPEAALPTVQAYEWDLLFARTSARATAAVTFHQRWRSELSEPEPDDFYTFRSDEMDELIASMLGTTDRDEYISLAQRASELVVREEIATLPAYFDNVWVAHQSHVNGFEITPTAWNGILMNGMTTVTVDEG